MLQHFSCGGWDGAWWKPCLLSVHVCSLLTLSLCVCVYRLQHWTLLLLQSVRFDSSQKHIYRQQREHRRPFWERHPPRPASTTSAAHLALQQTSTVRPHQPGLKGQIHKRPALLCATLMYVVMKYCPSTWMSHSKCNWYFLLFIPGGNKIQWRISRPGSTTRA